MTSNTRPEHTRRLGRTLGLGLGLGLALLGNLGDRAFSASAANSGIDPLQVLDLQIRNNAIVILDSSGSMRDSTEYAVAGGNATTFAALELVGDDAKSKMASAKQVLKKIIKNNETKVSFQFGRYEEGTSYGFPGDGTNYYLYTCSTVATAPEVACTAAAANFAFAVSSLSRTTSDSNTGNLPAPPAAVGTSATFYALYSTAYRVNHHYKVQSNNTALCATSGDTVISTGAWAQPATPTDWNDPNAVGYAGPPFIEIERFGNTGCTGASTVARFYFRGGEWNKGNTGGSCGGFKSLAPLADCSVNSQLTLVAPFVGPEVVPTTVNNDTATNLRPAASQTIRASGFTPIAETLIDIKTIFTLDKDLVLAGNQTPLWTTISAQTPVKQRTFVIFLTDGDDTCSTNTGSGGTSLNNALRSAHKAQVLRQGIANSGGAGIVDPASKVEVFMVAFGGAVSPEINYVAWGGSGMVRPDTGPSPATAATQWAAAPTQTDRNNCTTCRDALPAADTSQLEQALQAAIDVGSSSGEFSDQQSVTETVFEFAASPLAQTRYDTTVPLLLQSTFELPNYTGHLNAFTRGAGATSVQRYDAAQRLQDRLEDVTTGMGPTTVYTFDQLHNNAGGSSNGTLFTNPPPNLKSNGMKIKRRIFTTTQNGVNTAYTPANLLSANFPALAAGGGGFQTVALWPPTTGAGNNTVVAPNPASDLGVKGILDTAMGFDALTTVAQVQSAVPGACQTAVLPSPVVFVDCTSATAGVALARAKREAREIVLAYIAGARLVTSGGLPVRTGSTGPAASRNQLQYVVRPWVVAESTLAAPGIVTPPLFAGPLAGDLGATEYGYYRDGLRTTTGTPIDNIMKGLGLRNPDKKGANDSQSSLDAQVNLKPVMSVTYHSTNQGLHAFRSGPCPSGAQVSGIGSTSLGCQSAPGGPEIGGEELWAFVPYDLLAKLPALTKVQSRANKQYLLASPVRFGDVFVRGTANVPAGASVTGTVTGVWRTLLYFGRGQGGKYYSALDITTPGPFTRHSLDTQPPVVVWNRGNPDTNLGLPAGVNGAVNSRTPADYAAYLKMGETWSVPALGYVQAASYPTSTQPVAGTDFVLFTGSGYSDTVGEGKTFFVLDALTGDLVRSYDIADGSPAALPAATPPLPSPTPPTVLTNFLVASPVVYAQNPAPDANYKLNSPSGYLFIGNAASIKAKNVYFGDLHGRIWRFDATLGAAATNTPVAIFTAPTAADGNQPFATAVSIVQNRPNYTVLTDPGEILIYAEAGHDRRVPVNPTKPFKAYAFKDTGTNTATVMFTQDFMANFRGTVQPATAFTLTAGGLPANPVVFYAGVKFNPPNPPPPCVSSFDSVLFAFKGVTTVPGASPVAAFNLSTGNDAFITIVGAKINAIRVSPTEGNLVVDQGLNAQNAPPPPGVPQPPVATSSSSSLVYQGLTPGTLPYKELSATNVPYRIGSSVCRTEY